VGRAEGEKAEYGKEIRIEDRGKRKEERE